MNMEVILKNHRKLDGTMGTGCKKIELSLAKNGDTFQNDQHL